MTDRTRDSSRPSSRALLCWLWLATLALGLLACPTPAPVWPEDAGFADHTVGAIESVAGFDARARSSATGAAALKFVIVDFAEDAPGQVRYLDGQFYEFHDQWYWFRLINGAPVPGARARPLSGESLPESLPESLLTIAAIERWVSARARPPYDLRWVDERLYSDTFYELAVRRSDGSRQFGIGTLVRIPARTEAPTRPQLWAFELEYGEALDPERLARFFAHLRATLPEEIGDELRYIARSPAQGRLVAQLRRQRHALADRLLTYAELAVPGEIQVYNPGLIAGRLRRMPDEGPQAQALMTAGDPGAIWLMAGVPDELPAAAGLLTAVPQTPLAHINLLARDRGIPNAYLGGLLDDPHLDQLARVHAPVVVRATAAGTLDIVPIDEADYAKWRSLRRSSPPTLEPLALDALPYTVDLDGEPLSRTPALRRIVGGKAAGFVVLRAAGVTMPARPLAITVRAYAEHIAPLRQSIAQALAELEIRTDARARYLVLEGRDDYDARFPGARDQDWIEGFIARHPPGKAARDGVAKLLAHGGIKRAIRDRPLDPPVAAAVDAALREHFGGFAASQGLRFRSSSSVEDVEGFSGAGLYDSNTGFLAPELQAKAKARTKTAAWALRKTWASYWSWEAFEERRRAGLDHLAGNMAVLVHARFDDALEQANGVVTATYDRRPDAPALFEMELNSQAGATSVTNPPPELAGVALPEVVRIRQRRHGGPVIIERIAASSQAALVLDDASLTALATSTQAIAARWLELENQGLDPARARSRVTLDLEFRAMAPGWPAYTDPARALAPARMVLKQVRSLDPGIPAGAAALIDQPIPRELLLFAERVEVRHCKGPRARLDLLEVWTDPMQPALGHASAPFVARVHVSGVPDNGGRRGVEFDHRALARVAYPDLASGAPWGVEIELRPEPSEALGVEQLSYEGGLLRVQTKRGPLIEEPAACSAELLFASPDAFLRSLISD